MSQEPCHHALPISGDSMKTDLLKTSRKLWNVDYMPRELNRYNQLKWAQAVASLGDRWLLAKPVEKK
jgi:hypothetical protein